MKAEFNGSIVSVETLVPPKAIPVISLTLNLTERDAVALRTLCNRISGSYDNSTRGLFNKIAEVLDGNGIKYNSDSVVSDKLTSICMADYRKYS